MMSIERAKEELQELIEVYWIGLEGEHIEALEIAIKALEQGFVLDNIRAEIEDHCGLAKENHCRYCSYCNNLMGVREILKTIDKYKAESEESRNDEM